MADLFKGYRGAALQTLKQHNVRVWAEAEIKTTRGDFTGIILGLRIGDAIFRFYLDAENLDEKHCVISTSVLMLVMLNGFGVVLLWLLSAPLSTHLLGGLENRDLLLMFSISLLFQPLIEIPMTFIRASSRSTEGPSTVRSCTS